MTLGGVLRQLSRDTLFAYRQHRCELDRGLRETVTQLRLHRRGCRAGRRYKLAVADRTVVASVHCTVHWGNPSHQ